MALVSTIEQRADKCTLRAYKKAVLACKFQHIMMYSGLMELSDASIKHLWNCPITKDDIRVPDDLFGPNLGSLKGKTVHHPNPHVTMAKEGVPWDVMKVHQVVMLAMDIMFINKVLFLGTISRNLKFGTI